MRAAIVLTVFCVAALGLNAGFAEAKRVKAATEPTVERDCTPINGRFGYYGNPWCDTGLYRQEDIEFRQRQTHAHRLNGLRPQK